MTCNCDNDGSNEYIIELGEFGLPGAKGDRGEQGYSPVVSYTTNSDTIQFTLVNENSTLTTPNYYDYLAKRDLSNSPIYTILSNYPTNSQVASTYLKVDGSNANNPITLNNFKIQSVGTGTRVGSEGQLTLYGSTTRPAYLQTGSTSKSLALLSDVPTITNKLETDGSNATSNIAINGITFRNQSNYNNIIKAKNGLDLELSNGGSILDNTRATIHLNTNGNAEVSSDNNINLSAINDIHLNTTNGKVYYGTLTDATKEIATLGDINDATITITQGGVTKGSFTLNQSGNATIALESGGSTIGNQISLITEDGSRSLTLGINNTTKEAFMTYDIIGGISFDLNLISGKITPITLTKNSDGTYSVGLDYDNDTLKVNQNGKLYADIEAPTYTAGTGININNEEISVDSDYVEAHKAYLADGDTLTDSQGLEDVKYYNKSSFDLSKFTIVGSPTITDDGIASGLGVRNATYLDTNVIIGQKPFKIKAKVNYPNTSSGKRIFQCSVSSSNTTGLTFFVYTQVYGSNPSGLRMAVYLSDGTNISDGISNVNGDVIVEFEFTGSAYILRAYDTTGVLLGEKTLASNLYPIDIDTHHLRIGTNATDVTYDLKQFSVTVDGQEVFNGNKTGIDTIKPDDYTVVGTPTISADGIASGLDSSNYITCDCINTDGEIIIPVPNVASNYKGEAVTGAYKVYKASTWENRWDLMLDTSNTTISSIGFASYGGIDYETTKLLIKVIKSGYDYTIYLKIDDNDWILRGTYTKEVSPTSTIIKFQGGYNIDLNLYKNVVNGSVINQPCLKIPYTLSKTGSKIADASVRNRVADMYNQQGYAPYYTLDEANGNFTLPMGEIYGYITRLEGMVKDLQTRLTALESNINGGGASEPVRRNLLGMSPLSLGRPQLLGEFNPEDEMNTIDIEPIKDETTQEEIEEEPQETEEEPIEETVEEQKEPQTIENEVVQEEPQDEGGENE